MRHSVHDVVDAVAYYIATSVEIGRLDGIDVTMYGLEGATDQEKAAFLEDVADLIARFRRGERVTAHRTGDFYEPMRAEFERLHHEG